jgi:hypothetical protein
MKFGGFMKNLTWENLATNEKIIFFGAVGMLISYFLPWFSVPGWMSSEISVGAGKTGILMPLAAALFSCFKLYRSQGATTAKKVRARRWQIGIGIWGIAASFLSLFVASNSGATTPMIGVYLCAAGSAAVLVGALRSNRDLQT